MEIPKDKIVVSEKVAILMKGDEFGALGLSILPHGTSLNMFDDNGITSSPQYSPLIGIERFQASLGTCIERGWSIRYFGVPRYG